MKIFAQTEHAPGSVGSKTNPEVIGDEFASFAFQFISRFAIDDIHAEVLAPGALPFGFIKAFHDENQLANVLWNRLQPLIVSGRIIFGIGRQQLDYGTERAIRAENRSMIRAMLSAAFA